ncbi:glycosyl transferase [Longispora fulva]|uniref:hypothetical protein n=1 Tax=Longispora fulva TaxID=619741 RepID=UPI001A59C795|nr:glycosyl transferase [Longispora fulva]
MTRPADPVEAPVAPAGGRTRRFVLGALPHLSYLVLALYVTARLWVHRDVRLSSVNPTDHEQFLWFLGHAARVVSHLEDPFVSYRLNVPDGANMMANTSVLGLGVPLAPVSLIFGVQTTFVVALTLTLALTASAWYWLFSRHLVASRLAAYVGAGFLGFAPGMVAQAAGHPNLTAQFLVPVLAWRVVKLREGRSLRDGLILGLLITYQVFLNEEVLFMVAMGCALFVGAYALQRRQEVRAQVKPFLAGLAVAAGVAGVLLAYPLWVQFFGPAHYRGLPQGLDKFTTDLASFTGFARRSLAGNAADADKLTLSANEENAFFGWPLVLFVLCALGLLWRRPMVRSLLVVGLFFAGLSLGKTVVFNGHSTGIPGPIRLLEHVPPFDLATATRYTLMVVPVVGILLTLGMDALARWAGAERWKWAVASLAVLAALVPIAPTPLVVRDRPIPAFVTSGAWKAYVDDEHTLVSVPVPRMDRMTGMRWSGVTNLGFKVPRGYFIGPSSATDPTATWIPELRPTSTMLAEVAASGRVPVVTDGDRAAAVADLRYWQGAVVVLAATEYNAQPLLRTVTDLLGPPTWDAAGGVWLWDVRGLH